MDASTDIPLGSTPKNSPQRKTRQSTASPQVCIVILSIQPKILILPLCRKIRGRRSAKQPTAMKTSTTWQPSNQYVQLASVDAVFLPLRLPQVKASPSRSTGPVLERPMPDSVPRTPPRSRTIRTSQHPQPDIALSVANVQVQSMSNNGGAVSVSLLELPIAG